MKTLTENLLLFDRLNDRQLMFINRLTQRVYLSEGEYFAEPGNIFAQLAFVEQGVLRYNYYNRRAENITTSLIGEGNFVASAAHSNLPVIQSDYLQAITGCNLSVIGKSGMDELSATVPNWDNIVRMVSQKAISERRSRIIRLVGNMGIEQTASRYLERFTNLGEHLNVSQLLPYMPGQINTR